MLMAFSVEEAQAGEPPLRFFFWYILLLRNPTPPFLVDELAGGEDETGGLNLCNGTLCKFPRESRQIQMAVRVLDSVS